MKQYRITSADFVKSNSEIPDAILSDNDNTFVGSVSPLTFVEKILDEVDSTNYNSNDYFKRNV